MNFDQSMSEWFLCELFQNLIKWVNQDGFDYLEKQNVKRSESQWNFTKFGL